ncbi:glycosyltransferase family 4 protein [Aporhodopirellula aestuarii]|uniref:Glycosyltransferase family 4 protein n=1 Tax=Aporhodopirellula aestuarii TaxID=2950107 RepID=A0ABT0U4A7_9BACT|nr:glycosyltransferase family 1 protein [Aporhodopirellula aestuarii]MCM2371514.1 glycosyltransferase family 4 protein [Aporhodopirellula aestuarii]
MSKITVLVDGVAFENPHQNGVWRVFYEVMRRNSQDVNYVVLLENDAVKELPPNVEVRRSFHRQNSNSRKFVLRRIARGRSIRHLEKAYAGAIWHSTFYTPDPRRNSKSVVTAHDCTSEKYFYFDPSLCEQTSEKVKCFVQAKHVLAVSESTKKDVCLFYPWLLGRVTVATLGSEHLGPAVERSVEEAESFCLFVGNRGMYKNFLMLLEAMLHTAWPGNLPLKVVGSPFSDDELNLLRFKQLESRVENLGRVDDSTLRNLYSRAACFVFPSLSEGFGLPVVESQNCGTVPVLSDLPVFREVAGDSAIYFDPCSSGSIATAVSKALSSDLSLKIRENAVKNARELTWDRTAELTLRCYQDL